jgi:hypothetical protein
MKPKLEKFDKFLYRRGKGHFSDISLQQMVVLTKAGPGTSKSEVGIKSTQQLLQSFLLQVMIQVKSKAKPN